MGQFEVIRYDSALGVELRDDGYLSRMVQIPHFRLSLLVSGSSCDAGAVSWLKGLIGSLNGIVFSELDASHYDSISLAQRSGFRLVCPSMIWKSHGLPAQQRKNCRVLPISMRGEMSQAVMEVSQDFDSSHYAQFPLYRPFIGKMYSDKMMLEWERSGELIAFFSADGKIAGVTTLSVSGTEGRLLTSCVAKKYRGGQAYYEMICFGTRYLLEEKKVKKVTVECVASNIVVQRTWATLGYRPYQATVVMCAGAL